MYMVVVFVEPVVEYGKLFDDLVLYAIHGITFFLWSFLFRASLSPPVASFAGLTPPAKSRALKAMPECWTSGPILRFHLLKAVS